MASSAYSPECVEKLSEKSRRCVKRGLPGHEAALFGPFRPRYTGQIHPRSVAHTPFQTVSEGEFSEVRLTAILGTSPVMRSRKFLSSCGNLRAGGAAYFDVLRCACRHSHYVTLPEVTQ